MSRLGIGSVIDGKYEVLGRLQGGGMGEVYRVRHRHLDEVRVVKLLRSELASSGGASERFVREAKLASQVKHPRVATLHDFSQLQDQSFYMVWEYIEGQDVGSWLREKGIFPVPIALELGVQALSGLEAIHRAGIVHRDLSPDNLMITSDPRGRLGVKIIDLGLAKELNERALYDSREGGFGGKLNYCSPEHVSLDPAVRPDQQSDVFSLAIVLFQMIAGELPFEPLSSGAGLAERFERGAARLSERAAQPLPDGLDEVLAAGLAVDRAERFPAATSFREAIQVVYDPRRAGRPRAQRVEEEPARPAPAAEGSEGAPSWLENILDADSEAEAGESRSDQKRRLQALQTRELVEQYLVTGQEKLARFALDTLLEIDPGHADADALRQRIDETSATSEQKLAGQRVYEEGLAALERGDHEGVESALARLEGLPTLARRLRSRYELHVQQRQLDDQVRVCRARLDDLIAQGRMDAAASELELLALLDVPKLVLDLYRARIREARAMRRRVEERRQLDREFETALREGRWQQARDLVHAMESLRPDDPRVAERLQKVDREEQTAQRRDAINEAVRTIGELLARGDREQAGIALMVLKRLAPDDPRTREMARRVEG
ncbi:MAG TPA: protein kinase [Thermoanaerobaculia bacterium]|nr:protein kinase [Thermoanaerobaculia bacterium]